MTMTSQNTYYKTFDEALAYVRSMRNVMSFRGQEVCIGVAKDSGLTHPFYVYFREVE